MIKIIEKIKFIKNYNKFIKNSTNYNLGKNEEIFFKKNLNLIKDLGIINEDFYLDVLARIKIILSVVKEKNGWVNIEIKDKQEKLANKVHHLLNSIEANKFINMRSRTSGHYESFELVHKDKIIKYVNKKVKIRIKEFEIFRIIRNFLKEILPSKIKLKDIIYVILTSLIISYLR